MLILERFEVFECPRRLNHARSGGHWVLLSLNHALVSLFFLLAYVGLICDDQRIELLVGLHTQKLVLLSLGEVQ